MSCSVVIGPSRPDRESFLPFPKGIGDVEFSNLSSPRSAGGSDVPSLSLFFADSLERDVGTSFHFNVA